VEDPLSSASVDTAKLLKDLGGLWTQLGKEETEGSDRSAGVLRAVTMTFILGVEEGEDEAAASEALALLMHEHPSRAIVLKLRSDASAELEGRAFAQCWMPFGRRHQICCEQIELSAGAASFEDTASLLHGLVAPDLPVVFWCRSAKLFDHPAYAEIAAMADKVIVDSRSLSNPKAALRLLNREVQAGKLYGDLTWTRLTRWRQMVSGLFERMDCQGLFLNLNRVEIRYTHVPEPIAVDYLACWLKSVLGSKFQVDRVHRPSEASWLIQGLCFVTALSDVVIERSEKGIVETHIQKFSTRTVFEELDEPRLVREELSILERDPILARVLEIASQS
jgi:glucose-6-phosphate dehydrogenase assembly protein OpcA